MATSTFLSTSLSTEPQASPSSYDRLVALPTAKSKVWDYFGFPADANHKIIDKKKVYCTICTPAGSVTIPYSTNTTNLTYHLQKKHPEEYRKVMEEKRTKQVTQGQPSSQQTLAECLTAAVPYAKDSKRCKQLVDATANFICCSLQPISIVDESSFRNLLTLADPKFHLPHRTNFSTKIIPEKYYTIRAKVEEMLTTIGHCSITSDLWTSKQQRSYISLTVHFVDNNFESQSVCLQTLEVSSDHSADSISCVLSTMFEDWKIKKKVFEGTTDNAQNIVNSMGLLGLLHFPCIAHTLQLGVKKALEVQRVHSILARCKKLVEHFKKSTKEMYKLREKQEMLQLPRHNLICPTRWGSTLHMLERVAEQQAAICAVLMEGKVRHLMPEGDEWTIIEEIITILKPFQQATEAMSTEKYPSISSVKPLLYKLLEKTLAILPNDSVTSKAMKKAIKTDLTTRYQASSIVAMINVVAYLDPRYKELPFLSRSETEEVAEQVEEELVQLLTSSSSQSGSSGVEANVDLEQRELTMSGEPPQKRQKDEESTMKSLLGDIFLDKDTSQRLSNEEKARREISLYKAETPVELDSDPLKWWQARRLTYPLLGKLVQKYFSVPATSVPSERLFSTAGNVISQRRSCLLPDNADKLIFLFENCQIV